MVVYVYWAMLCPRINQLLRVAKGSEPWQSESVMQSVHEQVTINDIERKYFLFIFNTVSYYRRSPGVALSSRDRSWDLGFVVLCGLP